MAKRKRAAANDASPRATKQTKTSEPHDRLFIQIVTGSYERVLHGITAAIPHSLLRPAQASPKDQETSPDSVTFTDCFLLNAHTSAIKCLAISPPPPTKSASQKRILATGSTDEKINLFHLSATVPRGPVLPALGAVTQENAGNRSLGTLHTHDASITALHFPNRSKLLSACGNNVIAVTSTRTFSTLSLMKAPNPKHPNRPTGDTSTSNTLPNGINDFAVHPSMKLMISVGRAERSMRLWNLVTGKKAGVLSFERETLAAIGEGSARWGSGEGHRVLWSPDGSEFAVCFEKGACIFGTDCEPIALVAPSPSTKLHQLRYLPTDGAKILAASTEDGRVLFYTSSQLSSSTRSNGHKDKIKGSTVPKCRLLGQLGGSAAGLPGRIKDFHVLDVAEAAIESKLLLTTAGSDGAVRVWSLDPAALLLRPSKTATGEETAALQVGRLLGTYETSNRITCIITFPLVSDAGAASDEEASKHDDEEEDQDLDSASQSGSSESDD